MRSGGDRQEAECSRSVRKQVCGLGKLVAGSGRSPRVQTVQEPLAASEQRLQMVRQFAEPGLARLNDMITGQAAFVGVIDQFEVMMIAMPIVSPLVLFLRKLRPAN